MTAAFLSRATAVGALDAVSVLGALPTPVLVVAPDGTIQYVNQETQEFFDAGESSLLDTGLSEWLPADCPIFFLLSHVRSTGASMTEYDITLETPRIGQRLVSVRAAALGEGVDAIVLVMTERSTAHRIESQLSHRNAARSVTAMAAILAHEVKNPLSGIRGAAQLLEQNASASDRELTRLICDETDRIVALVDRMDMFSDRRPIPRTAVNVHSVLEHVRRLAQSGFGRRVRFVERYDPSLPPVYGDRDRLIQVFLNLVKNAVEAAPEDGGEVVLGTAYQHGVRVMPPGSGARVHLPLVISVQDNGPGIPDDLRPHLFDPFVTTKINGTGLGLALVAKIVGDHGGVIEFDSQPRRTVFKVLLPMFPDSTIDPDASIGPVGAGEPR